MGKKSRDKGKSGEREFIRLIEKLTSGQVKLQRNLDQCREGGDDCIGHDDFSFEVKRCREFKDCDMNKYWQQTVKNARKQNKNPVLAIRPDFQSWRILIHPHSIFEISDIRGCVEMHIELFCHLLKNQESMVMQ